MSQAHASVLAKETIEFLAPKKGDTVLDVTLGAGGHSRLFADAIGAKGTLIAFDADTENIQIAIFAKF